MALKYGDCADSRAAAAVSIGSFATASMSALVCASSCAGAARWKYARVMSFNCTGNSNAESGGETVDRVVLDRERAVSAAVLDLEADVLVDLLGRLHLVGDVLSLPHHAATALIDGELRVDEIAMIVEQPLDTVVRATLFVCGQRQDDVA